METTMQWVNCSQTAILDKSNTASPTFQKVIVGEDEGLEPLDEIDEIELEELERLDQQEEINTNPREQLGEKERILVEVWQQLAVRGTFLTQVWQSLKCLVSIGSQLHC
jgi:hypothetical protein